jgi:hypothetical protein
MLNLKKIIQKKCGSFKGKAKKDCIANNIRNRKEKNLMEEYGKNPNYNAAYQKDKKQIKKDTKKYGKSIANALSTIRFKKSK